jgi:hypothetical protein
MAGNKKNSRASANTRAKLRTQGRAVPTINIINPSAELKKLSDIALRALNRIIDQTGNFSDWMSVLHRLYIGAVSVEEYFKMDQPMTDAFNQAQLAIEIIKLRTHQTGDFGVMVKELDSITLALTLTDQAQRLMNLTEIMAVHKHVEKFFAEMEHQNKLSYPKDVPMKDLNETEAMVETLIKEHLEVKDTPIEGDVEYTEFREAA